MKKISIQTPSLFNVPRVTTHEMKDPKFSKFGAGQNKKFVTRNLAATELIDSAGGLPKHEEMIAIKTNGETDAGSFFSDILRRWKHIEEMLLATWIISRQNVNRLIDAIDSEQLDSMHFVMSTRMQKISSKSVYAGMVQEFTKRDRIHFKTAKSHAKTFSVTNGIDYLTVSGSANWTENPRIENYLIINSEELYNHHREWMLEFTIG